MLAGRNVAGDLFSSNLETSRNIMNRVEFAEIKHIEIRSPGRPFCQCVKYNSVDINNGTCKYQSMKTMSYLIFLISFPTLVMAFDKVKVGSSPVLSSAGIYLAQELGFFKKHGIEVELINFAASGGSMTMLLANDQLDVAAGNITSGLYAAILKGENFKMVADKGHVSKATDYIGLIVRTDHVKSGRFKSLKDLKGFKVGFTSIGGVSQQIVFERFLEKAGLKPADTEYIKMSYAEMNIALRNKQIDATIQIEPYLTEATEEGFAVLKGLSSEVYPDQQSAAIFFSPGFQRKANDLPARFLAAYLEGVQLYNKGLKDPESGRKVFEALKKHIKLDEKHWGQMRPVGLRDDGILNKRALEEDMNWYFGKKLIDAKIPVEHFVDESLVKKAKHILDGKKK